MAAALAVIYGGPLFVALLFCYLAYLSLDLPMGSSSPWDCALFEALSAYLLGLTLPLLRSKPSTRPNLPSPGCTGCCFFG